MNTMLVPIADIIAEIANNIFVCLYFVYDYYSIEYIHQSNKMGIILNRNCTLSFDIDGAFDHCI